MRRHFIWTENQTYAFTTLSKTTGIAALQSRLSVIMQPCSLVMLQY